MRLIYSLTLMQFVYDVGLIFIPLYWVQALNTVTVFFTSFGGVATSIWSNIISLVVVHIVSSMKTFDIEKRFAAMAVGVTGFSLVIATGAAITNPDPTNARSEAAVDWHPVFFKLYYWIRFVSILVNVTAWVVVSRKLAVMGFAAPAADGRQLSKNSRARNLVHPVTVLAGRLKWYPIVQMASRVGAAWYEITYGDSASTYKTPTQAHTIALVLFAIFTPLAGIGYFVIFLMMQREAADIFRRVVRRSRCAGCFRWLLGEQHTGGLPSKPSTKTFGADRESGPSIRGSMDSISSEIGEKIAAAAKAHPGLPRLHEDDHATTRTSAYHARPSTQDSSSSREKGKYPSRTLSVMTNEDGSAQLVGQLVDGMADGSSSNGHASSSTSTAFTGSSTGADHARPSAAAGSSATTDSHASVLFALSRSTADDPVHSPLPGLRPSDGSSLSNHASPPSTVSLQEEARYSDWLLMSDEQLMAAIDASEEEGYEYHDAMGNF